MGPTSKTAKGPKASVQTASVKRASTLRSARQRCPRFAGKAMLAPVVLFVRAQLWRGSRSGVAFRPRRRTSVIVADAFYVLEALFQ
jgi:hypothetical protein